MSIDMTGQTIGHYRIDRLLGQGGMGSVYQATDLRLQRGVALKVMHPHLASQQQFQQRFLQEARAAARLDHPSIVRVLYFGLEDNQLFLVMELVTGGSLRDYLKRLYDIHKFIEIQEAVALTRQIADALNYAHQNGMIHRDIKPDNVLLKLTSSQGDEDEKFRAVLTDFGLAKLAEGGVHSMTGQPMGTYPYMSPEQCLAEEMDVRTDIYALGVMLYELVAGRLPYQPKSITEAIRMHTRDPLPSPDQFRPNLPTELVGVISKAMQKQPDDRFQTAGEMSRALLVVQKRMDSGKSTVPETPPTRVDSLVTYLASQPVHPAASEPVHTPQPLSPSQTEHERLVIVQPGSPTSTVTIKKDVLRIGRVPDNDIQLMGEKVSRHHARLERGPDGRYRITDLGTTNGTWLDDLRLAPDAPQVWEPGQVVRIGDCRLILESPRAQQPTQDYTAQEAAGRSRSAGAASPPTVDRGLATANKPGGTVTQSASGRIAMAIAPANLQVEPGGHASMEVEVLNQGDAVDRFAVEVNGLPQTWVTVPGQALQLLPGDRGVVSVQFHPPRDSSSTAGTHNFQLKVTSQQHQTDVATINGSLQILPVHNFATHLQPIRIEGKGETLLRVSNQGNATGNYMISVHDSTGQVAFTVAQSKFSLAPGQTAHVPIQVVPKSQPLVGAPKSLPFEVRIETLEGGQDIKNGELLVAPVIPMVALGGGAVAVVACLFVAVLLLGGGLSGGDGAIQRTFTANPTLTQAALIAAQTADMQRLQMTQTHEANLAITETVAAQTAIAQGDSDGDGLSNERERGLGTSPTDPDTDDDGLTDGQEVTSRGTNPLHWDTDNDNVSDGDEVQRGMNPLNADTDGDGIADGIDSAPLSTSTPTFTMTPTTTSTSTHTLTPWPTATGVPPTPTATSTSTATWTPVPTNTSLPSATAIPTATATATATITATPLPLPTNTPLPTATPAPVGIDLGGFAGSVWAVAWAPSGGFVAGVGDASDPVARIWDVASQSVTATLPGHTGDVRGVAWSPDGARLATCGMDNTVRIWDVASQAEIANLNNEDVCVSVAWSPDSTRVVSTSGAIGRLLVWEVASQTIILDISNHTGAVNAVSWAPNGARFASASADGTVRVWNAGTGAEELVIMAAGPLNAVAWSPDSTKLAGGGSSNVVRIWDAASGGELVQMTGHTGAVRSVAWSPDGGRLTSAGDDNTVRVWESFSNTQVIQFDGFNTNGVAWAWGGPSRLAVGSWQLVKVFDAP